MAFFNRPHPNALPARTPDRPHGLQIEPIWFEWLALGGLLLFGSWLLGMRGVWALLLSSDPTGITLVIIVVFFASTLWCGARSRELQRQRRLLHAVATSTSGEGWAAEYLAALRARPVDDNAPLDLLVELAQAPHHTAWWVNGIQLKLGLLGKVIGFSVLALQIGNIQSFDASQSQDLLKSLTQGLGIALLTTMVGLVGNILLGLQLTRLDRYADAFVADCQRAGLHIGATPKP
ncbi:hypothetical protein [Pseudaquabacterium pictum]|uniref:MotA/TolQ/ExbB proton channel domain-containing protein n=1 Tax=Pseudaquabacterium pictum TaxID=2315236 RepID=A0A480AQE5_9BURK|nr:hypothetical protein [Rubrivivax pictus]GCL63216.1 hypothetical protein AQPW35_22970 [Rubrivivax pictus]